MFIYTGAATQFFPEIESQALIWEAEMTTDPYLKQMVGITNGLVSSYLILANCLKNNGALFDGQLESALRLTIEAEGAEKDRLDYQVMAHVLAALEGRKPPRLRLILGGKSEEPPSPPESD